MSDEDIYKTPDSNIDPVNAHDASASRPGMAKRFIMTFAVSLLVFIALVLMTTAKAEWIYGIIGSVVLSVFSGIVALFIPVRSKLVFVSLGVIAGLTASYLVGTYFAT